MSDRATVADLETIQWCDRHQSNVGQGVDAPDVCWFIMFAYRGQNVDTRNPPHHLPCRITERMMFPVPLQSPEDMTEPTEAQIDAETDKALNGQIEEYERQRRWCWHEWKDGECIRCGLDAQGADNPHDYLDVAPRVEA